MTLTGRRAAEPWKITSSILPPRSSRADCSPSTQRTASETFDLPQPLGPTMAVTPSSKVRVTVSANDLKPDSSSLVSFMRVPEVGVTGWRRGCRVLRASRRTTACRSCDRSPPPARGWRRDPARRGRPRRCGAGASTEAGSPAAASLSRQLVGPRRILRAADLQEHRRRGLAAESAAGERRPSRPSTSSLRVACRAPGEREPDIVGGAFDPARLGKARRRRGRARPHRCPGATSRVLGAADRRQVVAPLRRHRARERAAAHVHHPHRVALRPGGPAATGRTGRRAGPWRARADRSPSSRSPLNRSSTSSSPSSRADVDPVPRGREQRPPRACPDTRIDEGARLAPADLYRTTAVSAATATRSP